MDDVIVILMVVLMTITLCIAIIPLIPGPALLWALATVYALATDFERVPVGVVLLMTSLMLIGSTTEIWLRGLGMQARGSSCWGVIGSFIGAIIGTGIVPILGTLIGAVIGALLVEFMRLGQWQEAMRAGRAALEAFLLSFVVEISMSIAIYAVFLASLWFTA